MAIDNHAITTAINALVYFFGLALSGLVGMKLEPWFLLESYPLRMCATICTGTFFAFVWTRMYFHSIKL
jgi:hypothetical protein